MKICALQKKNSGFTLIELLVVIAIISLLSSVVLATLNQSRSKAKLAAIQEQVNTIKVQAELYRLDNGNMYNNGLQDVISQGFNCTEGEGGSGILEDPVISSAMQKIDNLSSAANDIRCSISEDSYAITFNLESLDTPPISSLCFSSEELIVYEGNSFDEVLFDVDGKFFCAQPF